MFTGLVQAVGRLRDLIDLDDGASRKIVVEAPFAPELTVGESVSCNGVCLTVTDRGKDNFQAVLSPTTLRLTTFAHLRPGVLMNLERSVTPSTRLGGHWVLGHVDGIGTINRIDEEGEARHLTVAFAPQFAPLVLPLGSITIDGISLTVVDCGTDWLTVTLIPHTRFHTTMVDARVHQSVNLEFDVLGKYVRQLLTPYVPADRVDKGGYPHDE